MPQYIGVTGLNRRGPGVRVPAYTELDTPVSDLSAAVITGGESSLVADEYFYAVTALGDQGEGLASNEDSATISNVTTNEVQTVTVNATAGNFTLTYAGQTTANIAFNASNTTGAASVRARLEDLSNIGVGDVAVTGGPGNSGGTTPYVVTFQGALAGTNVALMTAADVSLTGGGDTVGVSVTTQGNDGDQIELTWTAVTGAEGYRVYKGLAAGDYTEYFEVDDAEFVDDGTAGTAGDVPAESDAVAAAEGGVELSAGVITIVDVDDVAVRKALNTHTSIGQWAVATVNNDIAGSALPTNV